MIVQFGLQQTKMQLFLFGAAPTAAVKAST